MENQIPSLAVLSSKNMTLQDQVHFLYDFPFATILKRPFFQCILDEILQSLMPHQLMQYDEDRPGNPHMTKKIVDELMSQFSLEGLELISRSFHVDHPLARALDFAIHKGQMSGTVVLFYYFIRKSQRKWYAKPENKAKKYLLNKRWSLENKEKRREGNRRYKETHKEKIK